MVVYGLKYRTKGSMEAYKWDKCYQHLVGYTDLNEGYRYISNLSHLEGFLQELDDGDQYYLNGKGTPQIYRRPQ